MSKPKIKSRGLPNRVHKKHGGYYFVSVDNKWIHLGKTESEMHQNLANMKAPSSSAPRGRITMSHVIDEWLMDETEGLPSKREKTRHEWTRMVQRISQFFGEVEPRLIKPHHIRSFMRFDRWQFQTQKKDENGNLIFETRALGRTSANRHVEVLSTILSYAIQRGHLDENPCREVKRNPEPSRTHLPTEDEFSEARSRANKHLALLMDAAYMTGMRRGDLIGLKRSSLTDGGIEYMPSKTEGKRPSTLIISWTDDLRELIDRACAMQSERGLIGAYVFTPPLADHWTNSGLNSAWLRLSPGFRFHDIRAMAASRHESTEDAQNMMGHSSPSTTGIYRRAAVKVTSNPRISEESPQYLACA